MNLISVISSISSMAHTLYVLATSNTTILADIRELVSDIEKLINDFKAAKGISG